MRPYLYLYTHWLCNVPLGDCIPTIGADLVPSTLRLLALGKQAYYAAPPTGLHPSYTETLNVIISASQQKSGRMFYTSQAVQAFDNYMSCHLTSHLLATVEALMPYHHERDIIQRQMDIIGLEEDTISLDSLCRKTRLARQFRGGTTFRKRKTSCRTQ